MEKAKLPVNTTNCNLILLILMAIFGSPGPAHAQFPVLDESDKRWLGEQIFQAECAGRRDCLTAWNAGEEFPSLGIGHFIWIPRGQESRYEQTFPALVEHILATGRQAPTWLQQCRGACGGLLQSDCPF